MDSETSVLAAALAVPGAASLCLIVAMLRGYRMDVHLDRPPRKRRDDETTVHLPPRSGE